MKREQRRKSGKSGLELIEEATHLLRTTPIVNLGIYYIGALPFVLGLLYFWADMSRSPFAGQHLAEGALGVTVLFLWMKFCQACFASRMRAEIAATPVPRWNARELLRIAVPQMIIQPSGLFVIPLSLIPALPFAWVFAFYQNVTVLANGEPGDLSALFRRCRKQATLWPGQNHLIIAILLVFAGCVFLNWAIFSLYLPRLLKMLLSIDSVFTRSTFAMLNTTFFTAVFGLTYLIVDPITKVTYLLRCFYGESLQSGQDLKAELKRFATSRAIAALWIIVVSVSCLSTVRAVETSPPTDTPKESTSTVSPTALDRAIADTIHERKYTWRMPREKTVEPEAEKGALTRFLEKVANMIRRWTRATLDWLERILRKLFRPKARSSDASGSGYGWIMSLQVLLYALVAVVLIALALLLFRVWRGRRRTAEVIRSEAIQPVPDIADESVGADQLPEDGWTKLARELLERGEFRLAMRAFYLASLAHLAQRNLISLARFKSNRDYEFELKRRAHALPALLPVFGENLSMFERIWYGMHEVNHDLVTRFATNVERIKGAG